MHSLIIELARHDCAGLQSVNLTATNAAEDHIINIIIPSPEVSNFFNVNIDSFFINPR